MKTKVLVVEDDFIIALDIKEILEDEGYDVYININSVLQAKQAINEIEPNIVLIDINLKSDQDGIDLGSYLLAKDKIPFVYITSSSDNVTLERVNQTRPYGYIVKPFKPSDIKTTVSIVLNNNKHRKIDVLREVEMVDDEIPFIMKQIINYINEHIYDKIEIQDLVKLTRWESQYFSRLFNKYVGVTPYKYILNRKVEIAKTLLSESKLNITQISYELGFKSHSNFCSIFKKITGQTPENFKKWNEVNKYIN